MGLQYKELVTLQYGSYWSYCTLGWGSQDSSKCEVISVFLEKVCYMKILCSCQIVFIKKLASVEVTDLLFDKANEDVESGALWNNRRSRAEE